MGVASRDTNTNCAGNRLSRRNDQKGIKNEYMAAIIQNYGYMLDISSLCEIIGVSRPTIEKLLDCGDIPSAKIGNRVRVSVDDFMVWWSEKVRNRNNALADTILEYLRQPQ